jgi:thioredoxin reductase (NADPH)
MAGQQDQAVDVAIIGGSFAGVSAALYLARARRSVVVFDHGQTRNRFAEAGHAFFAQDGRAPDAMRLAGQADLAHYPHVRVVARAVGDVAGAEGDFTVLAAGEAPVRARRVILAFGLRDILPDLPGLAECWGRSAVLCPYCHGYELADRPTAVLMTGPQALHQVRMLPDWSRDLILFTNGHSLSDSDRADLAARGVGREDAPVVAVDQSGGDVTALRLAHGRSVARSVIYLQTQAVPSCDIAARLGCRFEDGPTGPYVAVDGLGATGVPGVWAAGDLAAPMAAAFMAASSGARAGLACHRSFLMPEAA